MKARTRIWICKPPSTARNESFLDLFIATRSVVLHSEFLPGWKRRGPAICGSCSTRRRARCEKQNPNPYQPRARIPDVCHHWSLCSLRHLIRRKYARALIGALKHPKVVFAWRLSPTINLESVFIERLPSRRQVSGSRRIKTSVKL